jgi:hypothetical protein
MASNQAADPLLLSLLRRNSETGEIAYGRVAVATIAGYVILRLLQARHSRDSGLFGDLLTNVI